MPPAEHLWDGITTRLTLAVGKQKEQEGKQDTVAALQKRLQHHIVTKHRQRERRALIEVLAKHFRFPSAAQGKY